MAPVRARIERDVAAVTGLPELREPTGARAPPQECLSVVAALHDTLRRSCLAEPPPNAAWLPK